MSIAPNEQRDIPAKIDGNLIWEGGDITIDAGSVNPHTYGSLNVTGNVTWTGGKLHMLVNADINNNPNQSDSWVINGTLSVTVAFDANGPTAGSPSFAIGTDGNTPPPPRGKWTNFIGAGAITLRGPRPSAGDLFITVSEGDPVTTKWDVWSIA